MTYDFLLNYMVTISLCVCLMALLNIEVFLHIGNALIVNIDPVLSLPFTGNHCVYLSEETFSSKSVSLVMK